MSAPEIARRWQLLQEIDAQVQFREAVQTTGPVNAAWWDPRWLPIADCGTGDVLCLDTAPARGGRRAQVIVYVHDAAEREVLYSSLEGWLDECASDLGAGKYICDPEMGITPDDETDD